MDFVNRMQESHLKRGGAMFGWRAMVGWINSLAAVSHTPLELYTLLPDGVGVLFSTLGKLDQSPSETEAALERLETVARFQATNKAEYIVVNSSPMVTHGGPGADRKIIARIAEAAGLPATTTTTAAVAAMLAMGIKRAALCSPYAKENQKLVKFIEAEGIEMKGQFGLDVSLWDIHQLPTEYSYRIAKQAFQAAPGAEALYLAGGRLRVLEIIEDLEQDLGVPVIASTPATVWQIMKALSLSGSIAGFGRLLTEMPPPLT